MRKIGRTIIPALVILALGGCYDNGGVRSAGYVEAGYPYNGWYDGHYGSIYDGYWGDDGYFYYRTSERDQNYRRGDRRHFSNQPSAPSPQYSQIQGSVRAQGPQGTRGGVKAPHFPHHDHN